MTPRLFDTPAPRLYTLPPAVDFLASLAARLREEFGAADDPDALTRLTILTPTRRAAKALGDVFAEQAATGVALLPVIRPIGDIDVDDPPFEPGELAADIPPAINPARRRFELARLIMAKEDALGRPLGFGGALALADPLAALLDDLADEDVRDLSVLREAIYEHLPADRREAVEFLSILTEAWPHRLAELGVMDGAERRSRILMALSRRWRETPPDHPVVIAGSTGSIPAARQLMKTVAGLQNGAVILPGLDWDMDEAAWNQIGEEHPQWAMKQLLDELGLARKSVSLWRGDTESEAASARRRIIAEALRPADATGEWVKRIEVLRSQYGDAFFTAGLDGLSMIDAPDALSEARICALLLREALEEPGRTAALVTPDRALAKRTATEMARFGIQLDDSGGQPLSESPVGAFLERLLNVAEDPGSVLQLSALWSNPLMAAGQARGALNTAWGKIAAVNLRGVRPGQDVPAVIRRATRPHRDLFDDDIARVRRALERLGNALAPLLNTTSASLEDWTRRHVELAEALAATDDMPGDHVLWSREGGEAMADMLRDMIGESEAITDIRLDEYAAAFRETMRGRRLPPTRGVHPRLRILGPMEARLTRADRIILGGLNEGVWPKGSGLDPWMSRGMRQAAKLGTPERRHGLSAHDFAQLAAGPDVILTRAEKLEGSPSVASRWLWRLRTLLSGALGAEASTISLRPDLDYAALAEALDQPGHPPQPALPPEPRPPVSERPRALSITQIRTWVRDPYAIYARQILGLRKLDPVDQPPGPRERGTALHEALHACFSRWSDTVPDDARETLEDEARAALADTGFDPREIELELARFMRAADWLLHWESLRRDQGTVIAGHEVKGALSLDLPAGAWTLSGRADRIDRAQDGRLDVIDYKTGDPASEKEVAAGFDPQLPLTAAIAAQDPGFDGIAPAPARTLSYLKLGGGRKPGEERTVGGTQKNSADDLAINALDELRRWIARFDEESTAYPSQMRAKYVNKYGDYDHLARRGEWASAPGSREGEG